MWLIGLVLSSIAKSLNPNDRYVSKIRLMTPMISASIWSGMQKIWASSWVNCRTRNSPCMTPLASCRCTMPNSAIRIGNSR